MWVIFALASAFFAGITSILVKIGLKNTDATLATALRTVVVLIFAWIMVLVVDSQSMLANISIHTLVFLTLSGLSTGGSWLFYFKALQIGDVNKVVPIDKSSTILTMILSFIFLGDNITIIKLFAIILIGLGTYLMIEQKQTSKANTKGYRWLLYAFLSTIFASLTAILGKVGIEGVESNLGTAIRTFVVLILAWLMVFMQKKQRDIKQIDQRSWLFIGLSGLATGFSWLCYYRALQDGPASIVVPIDKLSLLVTISFSYFVLHEELKKPSVIGLIMIVFGTLSLLI